VAFNQRTFEEDIARVPSGGVCIYPADLGQQALREDVVNYAIPVKEFLRQADVRGKIRDYMRNPGHADQ
jgi:2-oxoglutarate ferredoxin oxidoreductase subunit alpha